MSSLELDNGEMTAYKELLLRTCGLNFENDRVKTLISAVRRRIAVSGLDSSETYRALLIRDSGEFCRLVELLTVNETYFFREEKHLRLVSERLAPEMLGQRDDGRPVRIVSAGCSTGEEPYSISILLRERFGPESGRLFSIAGVDIDTAVIDSARNGVYGKRSFRGIDGDIFRRYFEPYGRDGFRVRKDVREQVIFEVVNLLSGEYPPAMLGADVIFYRNVSIYFPGVVQREIFRRLAELLGEGGYLIVGATETIHHDFGILTLMERDGLFFYRKLPGVTIEERRAARRGPPRRDRLLAAPPRLLQPVPGPCVGERPATRAARPAEPPSSATLSGGDVKGMFDEALELVVNGRIDAALDLLEMLIGRDRSFVKAHTLKGSIFLSASRFDEARKAGKAAISLDPLCLEASLILGIIARHEDDDDEAFHRFRQAIYLNPNCWLAHFHMAEMAFGREDKKRARSAYAKALEILENGSLFEYGRDFFPLAVMAEQFLVICRHKLSLLTENG